MSTRADGKNPIHPSF